MKKNLITVKLSDLIGKNISGLTAQVRNPKYFDDEARVFPIWRKLVRIKTHKESGKDWITLYWVKEDNDSCDFTGCTVSADSCRIQFTPDEFSKINAETKAQSLTTRAQRRQLRLDKAASRYAKALRQGQKRARYY